MITNEACPVTVYNLSYPPTQSPATLRLEDKTSGEVLLWGLLVLVPKYKSPYASAEL